MPVYLKELALSVARCQEVVAANDPKTGQAHPCHTIVRSQDSHEGPFQVPEAWAGNLASARVVFLSSNPAISVGNPAAKWRAKRFPEKYPTVDWDDAEISDFMVNRFVPDRGWVMNRRHRKVDAGGTPESPSWGTPEPYWGWIEQQTVSLVGDEVPWYDSAVMTEVVHCKSNGEEGVAEAAMACASKHMDRVLAASTAGLVVVVGSQAAQTLKLAYPMDFSNRPSFGKCNDAGLPYAGQNILQMQLGGRNRVVCFIKHPGARGPRARLETSYPEEIDQLRLATRGQQ